MENVKVENTQEEVQAVEEFTPEKAAQLFSAFEGVKTISKIREEMVANKTKVVGDEEVADKLSAMIAGLTPNAIRELSKEAIEEIYNLDGEGTIELDLSLTPEKEIEFKRDFLVYLRESDLTNELFETQMKELEEVIQKEQEELNKFLGEFGDLSTFMRQNLQKEYDVAEGEKKERLAGVIAAYDEAYTLDRIVDHYKEYGAGTLVTDYKHRSLDIFTRYMNNVKKIDFSTDLTKFNNIEPTFLPEKYHQYPNLFLFAVIKMYYYKKNPTKQSDGVFLSQLAVNLKSLFADTFAAEEKKELFVNSIQRVLDVIYAEVLK